MFKEGPFKSAYIIKDYDPRTQRESLYYQVYMVGYESFSLKEDRADSYTNKNELILKTKKFKTIQLCSISSNELNSLLSNKEKLSGISFSVSL